MITLREAKLTLQTIKFISYLGLLPYDSNVAEGKLVRLPRWRLIIWCVGALVAILHILHTSSQVLTLYVISDHIDVPIHVAVMHSQYSCAVFFYFASMMYASLTNLDLIMALFNQLFKDELVCKARPWRRMRPVDMLLRSYFPATTFFISVGWEIVQFIEPTLPSKAIYSPLLAPVKDSWILIVLTGIFDLYAPMFAALNFFFLILLLYLSCEKVRVQGIAARDVLSCSRLKRPNQRLVRRAMKSARLNQLYISWTNHVSCWGVFSQKIVYIGAAINCAYIVIRLASQYLIFGLFAAYSCILSVTTWYITCYFANLVPGETQSLHQEILRSPGPFFKDDVIKYMRSVRAGAVQDGTFRAIEQESFLCYVDFVVNQLVAVLLM